MTDIDRTEDQPEVEGHVVPEGEERLNSSPERLNSGPERLNSRTAHPNSEEEGAEVEGHRFFSGPERF